MLRVEDVRLEGSSDQYAVITVGVDPCHRGFLAG